MNIEEAIKGEVVVEFEALEEESHFCDDFDDEETIEHIHEQLRQGNEAAWFCAHVTASWKGFVGESYLGCCSYKSFDEFRADNYYTDMRAEARLALINTIKDTYDKLKPLFLEDQNHCEEDQTTANL